ncbi:4633_t:CDS:2 [Entrophospora sp. SA101]|nr:4633_t:CDS:2 [Entrophospora sp. SA101]
MNLSKLYFVKEKGLYLSSLVTSASTIDTLSNFREKKKIVKSHKEILLEYLRNKTEANAQPRASLPDFAVLSATITVIVYGLGKTAVAFDSSPEALKNISG